MDFSTHCDELGREGARFSDLAVVTPAQADVVTCPGWDVADLVAHVGFFHSYAEGLVRRRASERISASSMGLRRGEVDAHGIAPGLSRLLDTLRASDPDAPMWAWGADQHVRFWARRMLHETLIHRVDLEGAAGVASDVDPAVAVDGVDEFLANLERAAAFSPDMAKLVGDDKTIVFRTFEGPLWSAHLRPDGFDFVSAPSSPDAVLEGDAAQLLLVLYRRRTLAESTCRLHGREDLVVRWLDNSALM